jgi:predicted RNase H-like nuclease
MRVALGIDACPRGWAAVELRDGHFCAAHVGRTLAEVIERVPGAGAIAVDIPLGLLECAWRNADTAAKRYLVGRSSSVFMTPPRTALLEADYARARIRCRELTGNAFSIQAWGLKTKLLEANTVYESGRYPLWEVHPEVSFTAMGLLPADGSKKSWRGQRARVRLLQESGVDLPDDLGSAGDAPSDDLLDAAAAAWSADRIATHGAMSLPDPPELSDHDQPIAIWY